MLKVQLTKEGTMWAAGTGALPARLPIQRPVIALILTILLQARAATAQPTWSGDFVLTIKGSGQVGKVVNGIPMHSTWMVDRVARGRIVLDRMFKGGGIAGTPETRDTTRYETWIANSRQPLDMVVRDTGTYYGPSGTPTQIGLDVARFTCPAADARPGAGQVRSGILQFDRVKGTFALETPRMFTRCETSVVRTPKKGPPDWMAKAPYDILTNKVEIEFEVWHRLVPLPAWNVMTGPWTEGQTELVLSRSFTFQWMQPLTGVAAPVQAELQLVLRKAP